MLHEWERWLSLKVFPCRKRPGFSPIVKSSISCFKEITFLCSPNILLIYFVIFLFNLINSCLLEMFAMLLQIFKREEKLSCINIFEVHFVTLLLHCLIKRINFVLSCVFISLWNLDSFAVLPFKNLFTHDFILKGFLRCCLLFVSFCESDTKITHFLLMQEFILDS